MLICKVILGWVIMSLKFFNTETREKEVFKPLIPGVVSMYTCGPTVYDFAHIGNFRTYIFEDILRRTLKFFDYKVTQVMNLTDVDDKTIRGAIAKKVSLDDYTKPFKDAFFEDLKTLQIEPAEKYPEATHYIEEMIRLIQILLDKKIAYVGGDGSVYYSIVRFENYGRLSHLNLDELQAGASKRVANDEYEKETVADFVLWKIYDPERDGGIYWESPFGKGRPGWHLECSAMAMSILGKTIDIHVGGVDNIFPHHENEIAQSEACTGECFVKLWMHSEHLLVDHKKMSKSLGNFYTLRNLLERGYTGLQVRYLLLQTHYRTQLNFTFTGLDGANAALSRLHDFAKRIEEGKKSAQSKEVRVKIHDLVNNTLKLFSDSLADDLNVSASLAALFDFIREGNTLFDKNDISVEELQLMEDLLKKVDTVLGVIYAGAVEEAIPEDLQALLQEREKARREKNWAVSDQIRKTITERGYVIEDTPTAVRLKKA